MIYLINQSTLVSLDQAVLMAEACNRQMRRHIAPAWARLPRAVVLHQGDPRALPAGILPIVLLDDSDAAGALGYHTEEAGKVFARVFCRDTISQGGNVLGRPGSSDAVSITLSHEVAEAFVDPYCNAWVDGPKLPQGSQYALEVADPVEADAYFIDAAPGREVAVSNFVYPEWFDQQAIPGTRLDHMRKCRGPFLMTPGGYMVVRSAPGVERQIFEGAPQDRRQLSKMSPMSRTFKRGVSFA